jgi:hypothetical protein
MMNWNYLIYAILCLLFSLAIYVHHGRWVKSKKQREDISNFDRGTIIPQDWGIIITFAVAAIVYLIKFLFT